MSELDLSKYDGHSPVDWSSEERPLTHEEERANIALMLDAPLLLAEVRRLREELRRTSDREDRIGAEYHSLRQSHARLLAALLLVGRVERRGGVPYYNTSGSLIHQDQMRELGAAVAEAEALHGK